MSGTFKFTLVAALAALVPFVGPAQAKSSKISCTLTQSCSAKGSCTALAKPVVVSFCDKGRDIQVAVKGGKITLLNRISDEKAYKARPYSVLKGHKLDVGQWRDPDVAKGAPNLITFIMHEDTATAALFRGDPLQERGLMSLQGSCKQVSVNTCRANR